MSAARTIGELTRAIRAGEPAPLAELYRDRFAWALAVARRRSGRDESFCLDAVQETFLRVVRSLPAIETEAQLEAWLARTIESCVLDALRSEQRRARREARRAGVAPAAPAASAGRGVPRPALNLDDATPDASARRETVAAPRTPAPRRADPVTEAAELDAQVAELTPRLAKLAPRDAELVAARFRFGWTLGRIGAALGLGAGAVDGRLNRILARLRKELDDDPT
ncbi:MAG: sigma-70 family RNA polymerase sigma factor [Phycisphaerales bacterium]